MQLCIPELADEHPALPHVEIIKSFKSRQRFDVNEFGVSTQTRKVIVVRVVATLHVIHSFHVITSMFYRKKQKFYTLYI